MLDKYFVSRKNYNKDTNNLRSRITELTKELRGSGATITNVKQQAAIAKSQVGGLEHEIGQLQKRLERQPITRDLREYMNPVPEGETKRKEYMATVAGFFEGGLKEKLNYMHQQFRNQAGMFPLNERETDFFRSCINVTGLLLDWGEECVSEHRGAVAVARGAGEEDAFSEKVEEATENINKAINR